MRYKFSLMDIMQIIGIACLLVDIVIWWVWPFTPGSGRMLPIWYLLFATIAVWLTIIPYLPNNLSFLIILILLVASSAIFSSRYVVSELIMHERVEEFNLPCRTDTFIGFFLASSMLLGILLALFYWILDTVFIKPTKSSSNDSRNYILLIPIGATLIYILSNETSIYLFLLSIFIIACVIYFTYNTIRAAIRGSLYLICLIKQKEKVEQIKQIAMYVLGIGGLLAITELEYIGLHHALALFALWQLLIRFKKIKPMILQSRVG